MTAVYNHFMADVVVTVLGGAFSQELPEELLCEAMRALLKQAEWSQMRCKECGMYMTYAPYDGKPGISAGVPQEGQACSTVELIRARR